MQLDQSTAFILNLLLEIEEMDYLKNK